MKINKCDGVFVYFYVLQNKSMMVGKTITATNQVSVPERQDS